MLVIRLACPAALCAGSGKILKTELRAMLNGAPAMPAAAAVAAAKAAPAPKLPSAEAVAELLARAAGGSLFHQPVDAGLGEEWGRDVFPGMTYILLAISAAEIQPQVGCHAFIGPWPHACKCCCF